VHLVRRLEHRDTRNDDRSCEFVTCEGAPARPELLLSAPWPIADKCASCDGAADQRDQHKFFEEPPPVLGGSGVVFFFFFFFFRMRD